MVNIVIIRRETYWLPDEPNMLYPAELLAAARDFVPGTNILNSPSEVSVRLRDVEPDTSCVVSVEVEQ